MPTMRMVLPRPLPSPLTRRVLLAVVPVLAVLGAVMVMATPPARAAEDGLVRTASPYTVEETIERVRAALTEKGIRIFADINHTANAATMDLEMPDTHLLIFGSPKIGAPLMRRNPAIGIDLPIKVVVYADDKGRVWLIYNDPAFLADRHGLPADVPPFVGMRRTLDGLVAFAVKK